MLHAVIQLISVFAVRQSEGVCDQSTLDASQQEWSAQLADSLAKVESHVPQVRFKSIMPCVYQDFRFQFRVPCLVVVVFLMSPLLPGICLFRFLPSEFIQLMLFLIPPHEVLNDAYHEQWFDDLVSP